MTTEQNKSPPQHIPGPWQYNPESGLIHSLDQNLVCDVCADPDSSETAQQHATGFLIDTAPDLLEGAETTVAAFDGLKYLLPNDFLKNHGHSLSMGIEALRNAIATAKRGQA